MTPAQEAKMDQIHSVVQEIKVDYAKIMFHQEQHRKEIDAMQKKVDTHETTQARVYTVFGIAGVGVTAFFSWLFKH